jgi:hypothetical protein
MDVVVTHDDVEHEVTSSAMEVVKSKLPKLSPPTLTEKLGLDRRLYGAKLVKTLASKLKDFDIVVTMPEVVSNRCWPAPPPDGCQHIKAVVVVQAEQPHARLAPNSRMLMPTLGVGSMPPKLMPSSESCSPPLEAELLTTIQDMTDASKVTRFCPVIRVRAKQQIRRNQGPSKTRKLGLATKGESRKLTNTPPQLR